MHIGISIFPTDQTIQPVELGRAAEDMGFESLWFAEHSHIPVARQTPWGGVKDAPELPEHYWRTHEAFTAFAAIAATTTTLRLGTGIALVAQRDPIWTAKQVATLDHLSDGRVLFGIGYGWNKEEMASHGTAYRERRELLRERILVMKALWTQDEASFQGEYASLEPSWAWPKPVQRPHPPILMGGAAGPRTIADMVEFCDGWMPLGTRHDLAGSIETVRTAVADAGRDPATFDITAYGAPRTDEALAAMAGMGVTRVVFTLPQAEPEIVLEKMRDRSMWIGRF
jgi:probable F420-dependent oxidoreductase